MNAYSISLLLLIPLLIFLSLSSGTKSEILIPPHRGICWISAAIGIVLISSHLHADNDSLLSFDTNPALTSQIGESRLSKWLILHADSANSDQRINFGLLDQAIVRVIESGHGMVLISADLARGDVDLAQTIQRLLASFNFPETEVQRLLQLLATGTENETLRATLGNAIHRESTLRLIDQYLLETPEDWERSLGCMTDILEGKSEFGLGLLQETFRDSGVFGNKNLTDLIDRAQVKDPEAKWVLAQGLHKILAQHGAWSQALRNAVPPGRTFYGAVWRALLDEINGDSMLRQEYHQRLWSADPLYEEFQSLLVIALNSGGDHFIKGYLHASLIPESRFNWVFTHILQSRPEWVGMDASYISTSSALRIQFAEDLSRKVAKDPAWSDYLLWELTRPAEAATLTLRLALPSSLGNEAELCRELWATYDLGLEFSDAVKINGLFDFYPGGESEFRHKMELGTAEQAAILQFGSGFGRMAAFSDIAWSKIVAGKSLRERQRLRVFFRAVFMRDPATVTAWLETIRSNDFALKNGLASWLIHEGKLKDQATFDRWLDSVSEAIRTGRVQGNPDIASFKGWFLDFLQTETGFDQVRSRIAVESFAIPEALRESMALTLQREPKRFWRIYGMLTAIDPQCPISLNLTPQLRQFAKQSQLSNFLMEEVSAQNRAANDAMEPAWRLILALDSPTLRSVLETIRDGSSISDLYGLVTLALQQTITDPKIWSQVEPVLAQISPELHERTEILSRFDEKMFKEGPSTLPLVTVLLSDTAIYREWQSKLLSDVNFMGKGYIISDFIRHHTQLLSEWNRSIADIMVGDPQVAQTMLEALVQRRVGDSAWEEEVSQMRYQLARIILENRVLFESLVTYKNHEFIVEAEKVFPLAKPKINQEL